MTARQAEPPGGDTREADSLGTFLSSPLHCVYVRMWVCVHAWMWYVCVYVHVCAVCTCCVCACGVCVCVCVQVTVWGVCVRTYGKKVGYMD